MLYGGDYLGGKHYLAKLLEAHPNGWAGGIFLTTFGDARAAVQKMVKNNKFHSVVVDLAPFRGDHNYPVKLTPQMKKDAKWLNQFGSKVWISPFCEHRHNTPVITKIFDELNVLAPACKFINKGTGKVPGVPTEIHLGKSSALPGKPSGQYTVSFDGFGGDGSGNFTDTNIEKILDKYSDAIMIRWWDFRLNGKYGWKDKTPVDKRTNWPSIHYLKARHAMMKRREGTISWPNTALYKPCADDHGNIGQTKDGKAIFIVPAQKPFLNVKDSNGNIIDQPKRFPGDHDGKPQGARYYSTKYSYQLADLAERNTGNRLIRIEDLPFTDGDLRSGLFK